MNKIDNSGTGIAALGRDEDAFLAHVAPGEMVVPPVITPETRARLFQEMQQVGLDPNEYTVGQGMSINPITGLPEFGFLKKTFKSVKKVVKKAAPIVLPMVLPGIGGAISSGLGSLGGALGGIGSAVTGAVSAIPGIGGALSSGLGSFGSALGNFGKGILSTTGGIRDRLTSGLGSFFGGGGSQYSAVSGDTLSQIAAKNNVTLAQLKAANPNLASVFANPKTLQIGQNLTIPGAGGGLGSMFPGGLFGEDSFADKILNIDPNKGTGPLSFLGGSGGASSGGFGGGGILDTVLKGIVAKRLLDQDSPNPADLVPMGLNAFGYTPAMTEALKNDNYRIANLQPALIQGQQYANLDPEKMPAGTPIATAEAGGIMGLQEGGMMMNPNRMDNNGPGDITPAFLEPGEFVMTRPATQVLGARNLYKLMKDAEGMA
mgnify:FL=1